MDSRIVSATTANEKCPPSPSQVRSLQEHSEPEGSGSEQLLSTSSNPPKYRNDEATYGIWVDLEPEFSEEEVKLNEAASCSSSSNHAQKMPKSSSSSNSTQTRGSVNQYGGDASGDESSLIKTLRNAFDVVSVEESSIVEVEKKHWWIYAAKTKLEKNDSGYGLLKFFRHFHSTAHHVLYSILIGRPVVIFGKETTRLKIAQIFNCLIPFVPCYPSKSFKLLQWHQGILVGAHFQSFKLIGLCLPERLTIHELIHQNDLSCVTILDYESKKISGPAYSGVFFENFRNAGFCQTKFFDDLSLLSYIGSILSEIEGQVYMFKTMLMESEENDNSYDTFKSIPKILKQLSLKSSDSEIVKHLSHILLDPSDCTEIF